VQDDAEDPAFAQRGAEGAGLGRDYKQTGKDRQGG
jgi:hypothetical protein